MTRVLKVWIAMAAMLVSSYACFAGKEARHTTGINTAYTVETVPNVHIRDSRQYVSDPTNILTANTKDSINAIFALLERNTGIETAVVMLPSIGESDEFDFAHALFRHWGIGKKDKNNGLLILYVADIHRIRFVTGYGIEGFMTDAMSKRIQTRYMIPAFRQGNTDTGMLNGAAAVYKTLKDSMNPDRKGNTGAAISVATVEKTPSEPCRATTIQTAGAIAY